MKFIKIVGEGLAPPVLLFQNFQGDFMYNNDTIVAISTPIGTGGIAVLRVSGEDSFIICDKIFKSPKDKKLADAKTHTALFGYIYDEDELVDEVLCTVMRAPKSFTSENTVEISCHGGIFVTRRILDVIIKNGARLAEAGEFTKRAFLNGRLDMVEAQAVIDLINAKSESAASLALNNMQGHLSQKINTLRESLSDIVAEIDAVSDFPEEDFEKITFEEIEERLLRASAEIEELIKTASRGKLIKEGIDTVIIGKPNVGKSSLLNAILSSDRAIVTDTPGTTRDVIEETVSLGKVSLNIFDTAGIRKTDDKIETIGIEKSKEYVKTADLVLFMTDSETGITKEDEEIEKLLDNKKVILVVNKTDKENAKDINFAKDYKTVKISAKTGKGVTELLEEIEELFEVGKISKSDMPIITKASQKEALIRAKEYIDIAKQNLGIMPDDLISIDLRSALSALGQLTGIEVSENIVNRIFSKFCLGK